MASSFAMGTHRALNCSVLPPEIWIVIFELFPKPHLRLTCKLFDSLAKPIIFRTFRFGHAERYDPSPLGVRKRKRRLDYWTSVMIAPLVHCCIIQCPIALRPFLTKIPLFSNLRQLEFDTMNFDDFTLEQLCKLKPLMRIKLSDCTTTATQAPRNLIKIAKLDLVSPSKKPSTILRLLKFIQFTCNPCISFLAGTEEVAEGVFNTVSNMMELPILEKVDVPQTTRIIHFLATNPLLTSQIRSLTLSTSDVYPGCHPPVGSIEMPFLQEYCGPPRFLALFIPGKALRTIYFFSEFEGTYRDDLHMLDTLPQSSDRLENLSMEVTRFGVDLLKTIFSRFAHLKTLNLYSLNDDLEGNSDTYKSCNASLATLLAYLYDDLRFSLTPGTARRSSYAQFVTTY